MPGIWRIRGDGDLSVTPAPSPAVLQGGDAFPAGHSEEYKGLAFWVHTDGGRWESLIAKVRTLVQGYHHQHHTAAMASSVKWECPDK